MTDEERHELINSLYVASDDRWSDAGRLCKEAAEEIERLAALAQSDAKLQEVLKRCERWLRHEVEATFQEEDGYDLWEAVKTALAQSDAEPVVRCRQEREMSGIVGFLVILFFIIVVLQANH